jgi:hypothetical protein
MLRLLAQREQGYEDIAALMGLSVTEVRAKVKDALEQLDEAGGPPIEPPAKAPTPAKAEQVPPPPPEPVAREQAPPPPTPEPTAKKDAPADPSPAPSKSPTTYLSRVSLPDDRRRLAAIAAGTGVLIVVIVLLATGAFSGGSSESSSSGTTTANTADSSRLTQAILAPVDGGNAQGRAVFGRVRKTAVLEVIAKGLDPSPAGHSYTVWLYRSPKVVLRIGGVRVPKSGGIAAQFPVPTQLLAYVASGAFDQVDISLTSDAAYKAEVALAKKQKRLPHYSGTDVLRGKITGPAIKATSGG